MAPGFAIEREDYPLKAVLVARIIETISESLHHRRSDGSATRSRYRRNRAWTQAWSQSSSDRDRGARMLRCPLDRKRAVRGGRMSREDYQRERRSRLGEDLTP
jgi:hypothetical protein